MSEVKVAVVILNFNGKKFLEKFLSGIILNSKPHKIVVADNGSTDDSVAFLKENFSSVRIIENKGNYGYSKGYNLALKQIGADYFVLLNNDVEVTKNWIDPIIRLMDENPNIGACQPKLLDYNNQTIFEYAGAAGGFIDKYGYPFCRGRLFNSLEQDKGQFSDATEIFWASGACLFVRAKAYWQVGGLDDDYFAHMEEIDLCWRLKNFGYYVFIEPKSVIYHIGGGTLNKLSKRKTYLNFRNNLITLTKNHPPGFLFLKIIYRLKLDGIAALKFLFDGQPKHFFAVIRAHFGYYKRLPATLRKRKQLKNSIGFKFTMRKVYNGNVVFEHFLKGRKKFSELNKGFF